MESLEAYLDRKYQELELLNGFLGSPLTLRHPVNPDEVISQKFHIAAAMKAEHTLHDWALTETAWAHPGRLRAGPFEFSYDYQRADLEVRGPSFYDFTRLPAANETVYTASGMAAISALLFASVRVFSEADILVLPGSYGETLELIETHVGHLRTVELKRSPDEVVGSARRRRILLFDSYVPAAAYEATLAWAQPRLDLAVFDTTCFAAGSGRIRRFLSWAQRWQIPVVLVRSHTKLDSLGVEYGRLGSAVFVTGQGHLPVAKQQRMKALANEMRNAVRLFGGAALPAHFPPYVGSNSYRVLTDKRIAAILRNSRRTARCFASALPGSTAELHFAHGLYVTLASDRLVDEQRAREAAAEMAHDLSRAGLPLRHAGSFGFDFGATEWFFHHVSNRYAVRIAVADLPTALWDKIAGSVVQWWLRYDRQGSPAEPMMSS
jgi:hypothetical protein